MTDDLFEYTFICTLCKTDYKIMLAGPELLYSAEPRNCLQLQIDTGSKRTGCCGRVNFHSGRPGFGVRPVSKDENLEYMNKRLPAIRENAGLWKRTVVEIYYVVTNWRKAHPNNDSINAGSNGTIGTCLGGTSNEVDLYMTEACRKLRISPLEVASACASALATDTNVGWNADGSDSGSLKFRVKHTGFKDILIHWRFRWL
jgi:hypothetical protein